jgi:molecular chaperone GrpE
MTPKTPKKTADTKKEIPIKGDAADKRIAELEEQIKTLTAEKQDLFERLQRVTADYVNYQKRAPKQIADSIAYEKRAIIRSILPTLDNLNHAIAGARDHNADESVVKGVELVLQHMLDSLKAHGVDKIVALGQPFDPSMHEAMVQRTDETQPDGIVLEEYQNGYSLNGQVIRPCKVIVNKLASSQQPSQDKEPVTGESDKKEQQ